MTPARPRRGRSRLKLVGVLVAGSAVLTACSAGSPGALVEVSGGESGTVGGSVLHGSAVGDVIARPALALHDTSGGTFDLQTRPAGELTVLFFGYTNCPDVCPTTMADLAAARRQLGDVDRQHLQVVFVTEDPQTDTPAVLRRWLDRFDSSFIGLLGGNARTAQALDALKTSRTEIGPAATTTPHSHSDDSPDSGDSHVSGDGRSVEHSGNVYAFTSGSVTVYTGGTTPSLYAADFRALLHP